MATVFLRFSPAGMRGGRAKKFLAVLGCLVFLAIAFRDTGAFAENARAGLMLFGLNVLPVLFPFFFVSGLIVELDLFTNKRFARAGVVLISLLAGYPTSARMLSQLYTRNYLDSVAAFQMSTYTSTVSPIFVIATVGSSLYGDARLGILIYVAHVAGAGLNGLLWVSAWGKAGGRGRRVDSAASFTGARRVPTNADVPEAISAALGSAVQNVLAVGGLVIIFFIASAPLGVGAAAILELTTGLWRAEAVTRGVWRAVVPCAIVSFGGLCIAMQGFVFAKTFGMPAWFYFSYKITHAAFAVGVCAGAYFLVY